VRLGEEVFLLLRKMAEKGEMITEGRKKKPRWATDAKKSPSGGKYEKAFSFFIAEILALFFLPSFLPSFPPSLPSSSFLPSFFSCQYWGLNSGPQACWAVTLSLEPPL
jgi:hypothetical protein